MPIKLDSGSRFQFTEPILVPDPHGNMTETFGLWTPPSYIKTRPAPELIGKYTVTAGRGMAPHLIASDLYGTPYLDWILIAFNNAYNVLNWPPVGSVIEFPVSSLVFAQTD